MPSGKVKKVEALFAELKNQIGLRRLRRLKFVREQFFLAAVAQNVKRLVRFLSQPTTGSASCHLAKR
jgi:Transposase DDE domain